MDNVCVCTLACDSELQPMMHLACRHFMCACSLLLHIALHICSDWKEAANSLASVEEGEQNAAGEWTIIYCVSHTWGLTVIQYSGINNRVQCVSVPNERLRAGVVA